METTHFEWLVFKPSTIHGLGAFACRGIPAGTCVIEYLGEKITKSQSLQRCALNNEFIFALDDEFDLDGNTPSNLAKFINHSCAPNCEAMYHSAGVWIRAIRDIRAGEEITFNYGYDLEDYEEHPCCCGTPNCAGYIVAEALFGYVLQRRRIAGLIAVRGD